MVTSMTRAEARFDGLTFVLNSATVRGYPAEIDLIPEPGSGVELPDDLLAVIGLGWGPLRKIPSGWRGNLRVPSREPERSRRIERSLESAVTHLTQTLAAPPRSFHDSRLGARWGVVARRATPLFLFGGLIAVIGGLSFVDIPEGSIMNLIIMGTPPLLLFGAFGMRDRPPFEIPPFPKRSAATAWRPLRPPEEAAPPAAPPSRSDAAAPDKTPTLEQV
jgi:hypothetical protein